VKSNDSEKPDEQVICDVEEPVSLSFAVRYLNLFNKASTLSNRVHISMHQDQPLVIEYKIETFGTLKFYLAPKITDEEA
jgi:proliferating cell nuclear antigen